MQRRLLPPLFAPQDDPSPMSCKRLHISARYLCDTAPIQTMIRTQVMQLMLYLSPCVLVPLLRDVCSSSTRSIREERVHRPPPRIPPSHFASCPPPPPSPPTSPPSLPPPPPPSEIHLPFPSAVFCNADRRRDDERSRRWRDRTAIAARLARCARKSIGEGEREEEPEERRRRCLPLGLQISKTAKEGALIMANKESVTRFTYSKRSINKLALPTLNYL